MGACADIGFILMAYCLFFAMVGLMTTGVQAGSFGLTSVLTWLRSFLAYMLAHLSAWLHELWLVLVGNFARCLGRLVASACSPSFCET